MSKLLVASTALAATLATAGCVTTSETASIGSPAVVANASAATWHMPWQLNPSNAQSTAAGEQVSESWVPETGWVKGTPAAIASIGQPLPKVAGANRTVDTCRQTVESEAMKLGARDVEAASMGPHRRNAKGQYVAPVLMRITYQRERGYEVREAPMLCTVDRRGKIVDAVALESTSAPPAAARG